MSITNGSAQRAAVLAAVRDVQRQRDLLTSDQRAHVIDLVRAIDQLTRIVKASQR